MFQIVRQLEIELQPHEWNPDPAADVPGTPRTASSFRLEAFPCVISTPGIGPKGFRHKIPRQEPLLR